jgi:hypothetical protein
MNEAQLNNEELTVFLPNVCDLGPFEGLDSFLQISHSKWAATVHWASYLDFPCHKM